MARRWLHSLDVEVDEQRQSLAEKALLSLAGSKVGAGAVGAVSVEAASTVVLGPGATRERVVLTNISDERIDVAVGATAETGKGIPLAAGGGAVTLTPSGGCRLAINAVCASGGKSLAYHVFSTS